MLKVKIQGVPPPFPQSYRVLTTIHSCPVSHYGPWLPFFTFPQRFMKPLLG